MPIKDLSQPIILKKEQEGTENTVISVNFENKSKNILVDYQDLKIDSIDPADIKKRGSEFSFVDEVYNEVNNIDFAKGYKDFYNLSNNITSVETSQAYIWQTISAVANELGSTFFENIRNFIDNVSNIDLCKVNALQSLIKMFGVNYTIFNDIKYIPSEILNVLDIMSIKKEYLLNDDKVSQYLAKAISNNISVGITPTEEDFKLCAAYNNLSGNADLSNYYFVRSNPLQLKNIIDNDILDEVIWNVYYNILSTNVNLEYLDTNQKIYNVLSNNILLSSFTLDRQSNVEKNIQQYKTEYNISPAFKEISIVDNIELGQDRFENYDTNEQIILSAELLRRASAKNDAFPISRYYFYREKKVKEYFQFIEYEYSKLHDLYSNTVKYDIDSNYLKVTSISSQQLLSAVEDQYKNIQVSVDYRMLSSTADLLVDITKSIRNVREQLKTQVQKNFMKGTFLFLTFMINEYLKNNILKPTTQLVYRNDPKNQKIAYNNLLSSLNDTEVNLVEYQDSINYFNISTSIDNNQQLSNQLNPQYWDNKSTVKQLKPSNQTNIFAIPENIDSLNFGIASADINNFYINVLKTKLSSDQHLHNFLNTVFEIGADNTYKDETGKIVCEMLSNNQPVSTKDLPESAYISTEWYNYKVNLFNKYTGLSTSDRPYQYSYNTIHPSYQIHPYLYSFIEKTDYSYAIENIVNLVNDNLYELIKDNIDNLLDKDGYLINEWLNPLNTNSDYISRYEALSHKDELNTENPVVNYDGVFYPKAVYDFLHTTLGLGDYYQQAFYTTDGKFHLKSLSPEIDESLQYNFYDALSGIDKINDRKCFNPWYMGLNLSKEEREVLAKQLYEFRDEIKKVFWGKKVQIQDTGPTAISVIPAEQRDPVPGVSPDYDSSIPSSIYAINDLLPCRHTTIKADGNYDRTSALSGYAPNFNIIDCPHDIDAYSRDKYGNIYAILKNYQNVTKIEGIKEVSDETKKNTLGVLWIRKKNQPIALPAILLKNGNFLDISQVGYRASTGNSLFKNVDTISTIYNGLQAASFYDMFMAVDNKTLLLQTKINDKKEVLITEIAISKNLTKNISEIYFNTPTSNIDKITYTNNFNFVTFYQNKRSPGALFYKKEDFQHISIESHYFDISSKKIIKSQILSSEIPYEISISDNFCFDIINDNFKQLEVAYLANIPAITNVKNSFNNSFNYTSELTDYTNKFEKFIVTKSYHIYDQQILEVENGVNVYNIYAKNGFYPLIKQQNAKLTGDGFATRLNDYGLLKFEIFSPSCSTGIDFKFTAPMRLFESYNILTSNNQEKVKYAFGSYSDVHYLNSSNSAIQISDAVIYDPYQIQQRIKNGKLQIKVDESYFKENEFGVSQYDKYVKYPWVVLSANNDTYLSGYATTSNLTVDTADTYTSFEIFKDEPISVSWTTWTQLDGTKNIKLDFNANYYNKQIIETPMYDFKENIYNHYHVFLNLDKPGYAGYLKTYTNDETLGHTYYIKNISEPNYPPRFMLSVVHDEVNGLITLDSSIYESDSDYTYIEIGNKNTGVNIYLGY